MGATWSMTSTCGRPLRKRGGSAGQRQGAERRLARRRCDSCERRVAACTCLFPRLRRAARGARADHRPWLLCTLGSPPSTRGRSHWRLATRFCSPHRQRPLTHLPCCSPRAQARRPRDTARTGGWRWVSSSPQPRSEPRPRACACASATRAGEGSATVAELQSRTAATTMAQTHPAGASTAAAGRPPVTRAPRTRCSDVSVRYPRGGRGRCLLWRRRPLQPVARHRRLIGHRGHGPHPRSSKNAERLRPVGDWEGAVSRFRVRPSPAWRAWNQQRRPSDSGCCSRSDGTAEVRR